MVEDNEGDAELVIEAFGNRGSQCDIIVIDDGEEALRYLSGDGKFKDEDLPDLILLDINLPKIDGKEILVFIKNSEPIKHIPVVMLTTSSLQSDINFAYKNHANCYIVKSGNLAEFNTIMEALEIFWMTSVTYANKN